ncbi:MAG TPA: hypothetical protein ENK31_02455 [Nannocystis exedens]|nr:hypothetical protein [Nannocystis exedens]
MIERRSERSNIPWEAASLYLKSISESCGLHTMVIASPHGLSISGIGQRPEALAAVAPLVAEEPANLQEELLQAVTSGEEVQIWRVQVRGRPFYLAALGEPNHLSEEVQFAIDRIFGPPAKSLPN